MNQKECKHSGKHKSWIRYFLTQLDNKITRIKNKKYNKIIK